VIFSKGKKVVTPHIAKIKLLRTRNMLIRPRLFNLLDSCEEYPVTWLHAPPGSGKTTLVASYLEEKKLKAIWYQVDERDSDQATFFYYMGLAAANAAPRIKRPLPLLTREYSFGIPTFTLRFFESLYERLKPPFVIVFDNYQLVPDDSPFHDRICQGLEIIPEGIRIIVLSRNNPPPQFARLQANDHIGMLDSSSINFTFDETKAYLKKKGFFDPPEHSLLQLHERNQGWAAGLTLFAKSTHFKGGDWTAPVVLTHEVFHYFTREIFSSLDHETQNILLKTAYLPKMTNAMAERLTNTPQASEILNRLYREHFFIQRGAVPDPSYQYHPLFREFLLAQGEPFFTADQKQTLLKDAAAILEEAGQIEDAVELLLAAAAWGRLPGLFLAHGYTLIAQGRINVVKTWVDQIPKDILESSPWLLYWKGMSLKNPGESKKLLEKVFAMFDASGDRSGAVIASSDIVRCCFETDDFTDVELWLDRFENLFKGDRPPLPLKIEAMLVHGIFASLIWCHPYRSQDIRYWFERGLQIVREIGDIDLELIILSRAVVYFADHFRLEEALFYSSQGDGLVRYANTAVAILDWKTAQMTRAYVLGAHGDELVHRVSDMLEFIKKTGIFSPPGAIPARGALHQLQADDLAGAEALLQIVSQVIKPGTHRAVIYYQMLWGWFYFLKNDIPRAASIVKAMPEPSAMWGTWVRWMVFRLQSLILWTYGDRESALALFSEYKRIALRFDPMTMQQSSCNLCESYILLDSGDEEGGVEYLTRALAIAKELNYMPTAFILPPAILIFLYTTALKHSIEVEYVRRIIRDQNLFPREPPVDVPSWPWPIRIFTLGRFELLIDDNPIEITRLKKKPLLLLKALIALGGESVREETLSELLWPDAEGDAAHDAFKTTVLRLRRLLADDEAILFHEGRMSLNPRRVWADTWAFRKLTIKSKGENSVSLASEAMDLYRGEFLPFEDENWMISPREKWKDRFVRFITAVAERLEGENNWDKACDCYRQALDADDLAEQLYQRLMTCYVKLGDAAAASSVYRRLCQVLKARLGIDPSARTQVLFRQIVKP
jgi:LuxR family transcriptional regulator, maltose regulon positive regulatory protein